MGTNVIFQTQNWATSTMTADVLSLFFTKTWAAMVFNKKDKVVLVLIEEGVKLLNYFC